jgi:hypothetical protein
MSDDYEVIVTFITLATFALILACRLLEVIIWTQ